MDWRTAFMIQARSEFAVLTTLNKLKVEYCHRLHYLQMVTEKLSKAFSSATSGAAADPPPPTHAAFVKMLQSLKGRRDLRRHLGFTSAAAFRAYIDSLLDLAGRIEQLAPALAGLSQPNPEYPWRDPKTGEMIPPAHFPFDEFDPKNPKMLKLDALVRALLHIGV